MGRGAPCVCGRGWPLPVEHRGGVCRSRAPREATAAAPLGPTAWEGTSRRAEGTGVAGFCPTSAAGGGGPTQQAGPPALGVQVGDSEGSPGGEAALTPGSAPSPAVV